jgi:hypothetical protein
MGKTTSGNVATVAGRWTGKPHGLATVATVETLKLSYSSHVPGSLSGIVSLPHVGEHCLVLDPLGFTLFGALSPKLSLRWVDLEHGRVGLPLVSELPPLHWTETLLCLARWRSIAWASTTAHLWVRQPFQADLFGPFALQSSRQVSLERLTYVNRRCSTSCPFGIGHRQSEFCFLQLRCALRSSALLTARGLA